MNTGAERPRKARSDAPTGRRWCGWRASARASATTSCSTGSTSRVAHGEVLVIIGPSGSGKSTLLRCVNLLEPIQAGRIFLEGDEITRKGVNVSAIRQRIGIVFQQFNLFPQLTALDNLTLAARRIRKMPRREAEARAHELLAHGGARGEGEPAPAPALRRPAAAGRDRSRADDASRT